MKAVPPDDRLPTALECARDAFLRHVEERRLRLFRACLQTSLCWTSSLALSFARHVGLNVEDVLQVLRPPPFWPPSTGSLAPPAPHWTVPARPQWKGGGGDRLMSRVAHSGGHVMRVGGGDWVGWRVSGDTLEVAARLGAGVMVTNRGTLRLRIPGGLPETVCAAMPGRPLAALLHHPFLADDVLTVASVERGGGDTVLRVRTGSRPIAPPWSGQLAALLLVHGRSPKVARHLREERDGDHA